jgi:hypothetical protein
MKNLRLLIVTATGPVLVAVMLNAGSPSSERPPTSYTGSDQAARVEILGAVARRCE